MQHKASQDAKVHTRAADSDWRVCLTARQPVSYSSFFKDIGSQDEGYFSLDLERKVPSRN